MSSAQNEEIRHRESGSGSVVPFVSNSPIADDANMEVEEEDEEDEDVDFIPFLRGGSPSEASSSLSSDNECLGDNAESNFRGPSNGNDDGASSRLPEEARDCEDEETVMQAAVHGRDDLSGSAMEASPVQKGDGLTYGETSKDSASRSESNRANFMSGDGTFRKPALQMDDEDAICRRTRARHSLANYTLEELETFLQESDDDGDFPNGDDEEEYRKFLAAVLSEGADDGNEGQGDENVDEDEDNDDDFELEIEEALESDIDENVDDSRTKNGKQDGDAHMPVTRQKKRLKESAKDKKTLFGQAKIPLRPLMPYESTTQASTFPNQGCQLSTAIVVSNCSSSASGADLAAGFTAQQIGQLYCLIHEHVQLLIQIFSVSILDPSKQEVANGVRKMMVEMNCRREEALGQRKNPYPEFCFHCPNLQSSLPFDFHQTANSSYWAPLINNPVLSVLDVAPLRLVKSFMTDVSDTVLRYRQSHVEDLSKSHLRREPLFPLPALESSSSPDKDTSGGITTMYSHALSALQVSPGQAHSKRSLASVLVENTKKESVALVPRDIAKSAQRFCPLFNAALFPHKPPAAAVANRVLFTDAEDGLLAMGLMQYNNDWAAIQQRFLPCKSTHQIFVRQKNRSSSKAPENPIKAVRRMKTSPLTTDEKARIYEGLRLFKNDWFSVWKFIVPHRDPSLLPRLWRIATGTQKSYKKSEAMKEKRRFYEAKRRKIKALMDECQTSSDKEQVDNGGDNSAGDVDGDEEAYVHEAFLADTDPGSSKNMSGDAPIQGVSRSNRQSVNLMPVYGGIIEPCTSFANGSGHRFQSSPAHTLHPLPHSSQGTSSKQNLYDLMSRASTGHMVSQPMQSHKNKGFRVVKLAPGLPPVNLPPSVRVISQSSFKKYHSDLPVSAFSDAAMIDHISMVSQSTRVRSGILNPGEHSRKCSDNDLDCSQIHDDSTRAAQVGTEENTSESDLQMHPLLFQAPENQLPSYSSSNMHAMGSTIHSSSPRNLHKADFCLSRSQCFVRSDLFDNAPEQPEKAPSDLHTIDFHPLLQRSDSENGNFASEPSLFRLSGDVTASQNGSNKSSDHYDCMSRRPISGDNPVATGTASIIHKENNLDLDIRLCSGPHKGKTLDREDNLDAETRIVLEHRMPEKDPYGNVSFSIPSSRSPEVSTSGNLSLQTVLLSNGGGCDSAVDVHNDPIPGIIMEQEELSDSEEDVEHVEFEREEIDDSEDDDIGGDLHSGLQNKEFPFFGSKEEEIQANQAVQSKYLMNRSGKKSEKPGRSSTKANGSCVSPRNAVRPRSKKKRSLEDPEMHPLPTVKSKATSASRKRRR